MVWKFWVVSIFQNNKKSPHQINDEDFFLKAIFKIALQEL